ncbi:hypothetical protein GCM10007971_10510 [Oceanobacillus indicireducens]|uniref:Methylated-DNA-[protein]-cysteine S-methyltransferase DNA binding domain-containing protein n=1 Tax=Oceanobacillus indicireducens TaxID=1004261 RepID=A0A918D0A8_9BACI|nr:hypothetical protein GCM10007971_10510 [Oceanobacillus indicireducens]
MPDPRAARQVARILHKISKIYNLPWHRVINTNGYIAPKEYEQYYEQLLSLEAERIEVDSTGRMDIENPLPLKDFAWI